MQISPFPVIHCCYPKIRGLLDWQKNVDRSAHSRYVIVLPRKLSLPPATRNENLALSGTESRFPRLLTDYLDPVEESGHAAGQKLARELRGADLGGVVYPSSRRAGGSCLAAFRTTLVQNIRQGATWELTWAGSPEFAVAEV